MKLDRIDYNKDLNDKQKEQYNYHKVSALLSDFGYASLLLSDDYNGADFLAMHRDGDIVRIQLKSRITIDEKYMGKDLYMAFPVLNRWCLVPHDTLLTMVPWLNSSSWVDRGAYSSPRVSKQLTTALEPYFIN